MTKEEYIKLFTKSKQEQEEKGYPRYADLVGVIDAIATCDVSDSPSQRITEIKAALEAYDLVYDEPAEEERRKNNDRTA